MIAGLAGLGQLAHDRVPPDPDYHPARAMERVRDILREQGDPAIRMAAIGATSSLMRHDGFEGVREVVEEACERPRRLDAP